jgi:hypothetical protein
MPGLKHYSTAIGFNSTSKMQSGLSIGQFNDISDTPNGSISNTSDRLFQIGNGVDSTRRANAITVLRNGNLGLNLINPSSTLHVNGFTKLGNDAPKIKTKKITSRTHADSGGSIPIPHGLGNADKILSIDVMVESEIGQWVHGWYDGIDGYKFNYYLTNTNVIVNNKLNHDEIILDRPVRILIVYEE